MPGASHQTLGTPSRVSREKSPVSAEFLKGRVRYLEASLSPRPEEPLLAQEFTVVPGKGKEWSDSSKDQFPLRGRAGREGHPQGSWASPMLTGHRERRLSRGTLGSQGWRRVNSTGGPTGGRPSSVPYPHFSLKTTPGQGKTKLPNRPGMPQETQEKP